MCLKNFTKKCIIVTFCIGTLLYFFYPRYEFLDSEHRVNKVTGASEYFSRKTYDHGWRE